MLTRRRFIEYSALTSVALAYRPLLLPGMAQTPRDSSKPLCPGGRPRRCLPIRISAPVHRRSLSGWVSI